MSCYYKEATGNSDRKANNIKDYISFLAIKGADTVVQKVFKHS